MKVRMICEEVSNMGKPIVISQAGLRILIDPDDAERKPKPMMEYQLTPEEIEKRYGHIKRQPIGTVILGPDSDKVIRIRMREKEEKDMSKKIEVNTEDLLRICRAHGTGKEGYIQAAKELGISEKQAENQIYLRKIRRLLSVEEATSLVKADVEKERAELHSDINSHEEHNGGEFVEIEEYPDLKEVKNDIRKSFDIFVKELPPYDDDIINHPSHYTTGSIEVIDYLQDKLSPEKFEGFCIGNALKYLSRYEYKGGLQDLKKGAWYLDRIIKVKETA
jgi:hypothetical protein